MIKKFDVPDLFSGLGGIFLKIEKKVGEFLPSDLPSFSIGANSTGQGKTSSLSRLLKKLEEVPLEIEQVLEVIDVGNSRVEEDINLKKFAEKLEIEQEKRLDKRRNEIATDGRMVGNRVNNGRIAEDHMCDIMTDEDYIQLADDTCKDILRCSLDKSSNLVSFISMFVIAIRDFNEHLFRSDNKLAHLGRMLKMANLKRCGARALQKFIAWYDSFKKKDYDPSDSHDKKILAKFRWCQTMIEKITECLENNPAFLCAVG